MLAIVFVLPEYNYGFNAPFKNAVDYLNHEWQYKPVGFVSYGGVAGGTRAVQQLKPVVVGLKMTPLFESVYIPFVTQFLDEERRFRPGETTEAATAAMLDELERWVGALQSLRAAAGRPS